MTPDSLSHAGEGIITPLRGRNSPRITFIGCGRHAMETLGPSLARLGYEPMVVVDCVEECAERFAEQFAPSARVLTSWEQALDNTVERVIVAGPPALHEAVATACLAMHIPLLVEKPPASSASAARLLAELAVHTSSPAFVGFNFRFAPAVLAFRSVAQEMGPLAAGEINFFSRNPQTLEGDATTHLESWMWGNGIHAVDLLHFLFGKPQEWQAYATTLPDGAITITALARFTSRAIVVFRGGSATPSFDVNAELRDTHGRTCKLHSLHSVVATQGGRWSPKDERVFHHLNLGASIQQATPSESQRGHREELHAFIQGGSWWNNLASLQDGAAALDTCEQITNQALNS